MTPSSRSGGNIYPFPLQDSDRVVPGGGPPHGPGVEARVARLEDQFGRIEALLRGTDDRVHRLEVDSSEMKGRLSGLPSTWALVTTIIGGQITLVGLLFAALRLIAPC